MAESQYEAVKNVGLEVSSNPVSVGSGIHTIFISVESAVLSKRDVILVKKKDH